MNLPTAPPFYTIRPLPKLEALIDGSSNAVPPARTELADPWTKPPDKGAAIPPPGQHCPPPPPPPPPAPSEEPKKADSPPLPNLDPFWAVRMLPWPGHGEQQVLYAIPAPLVPPWNALRGLVELRDERTAGGMALSNTTQWAMRLMEMEYLEEAKKKAE